MNDMEEFRLGIEAGYTLAVEDLRTAVETGAVGRKCREAVAALEGLSLDAADRWLEGFGEEVPAAKG